MRQQEECSHIGDTADGIGAQKAEPFLKNGRAPGAPSRESFLDTPSAIADVLSVGPGLPMNALPLACCCCLGPVAPPVATPLNVAG